MPIIPDFKPVEGVKNDAAPSTGSAMAAGVAIQRIGAAVTDVGNDLGQFAEKKQQENDFAAESRAALAMQKAVSDHELFRTNNPDPTKWEQDINERLAMVRESTSKETLSPMGRQKLDLQLNEWGIRYGQGTRNEAEAHRRATNRTDIMRLYDAHMRAGQFDGAGKTLAEAEASGNFHKGELDPDRVDFEFRKRKWEEDQADKAQQNEIAADPAGWWEKHKDTAPDGMEPARYQRMRDYARGRLAERSYEDTDTIEDAIVSGKITRPEEIDHMGADLRPSVREKLKNGLIQRQSDRFKAEAATPQYQNRIVGEIGGMLRDWNPQEEGFDERYVDMASKVRTLPQGAARDELERQIDAVRSGRKAEIRTHADAAHKALDDFAKAGGFGNPPEVSKTPLKRMIDDGFFKDAAKLQRLGFSESQAGQIKSASTDPAAAQKLFTDLWKDRPTGSVNASEAEVAIADAIRLGHAITPFDDPSSNNARMTAIMERDEAYGAAKQKLADWLKRNPSAGEKEINSFVRDLSDEPTAKRLSSGIYDRKSTAMAVDVKLSNYGYASDSTPDSNSSKGIGHANNSLIDGTSAAISKSLADRLGLKSGDMIDIETTQGKFRVRYDDTVPTTDSRTGDLPETIDLYRKKDGSNGWGGRVTSISKVS